MCHRHPGKTRKVWLTSIESCSCFRSTSNVFWVMVNSIYVRPIGKESCSVRWESPQLCEKPCWSSRCSNASIESLGWSSRVECGFLSNSQRYNCQRNVSRCRGKPIVFDLISDLFRNELEREYVQLLQFNVNVGSSIYAKYYFDLRQLAKEHKISFPDELLTKEKAIKLEASSIANARVEEPQPSSNNPSNSNQFPISSHQQSLVPLFTLRRSASVEFNQSPRKSLLIISWAFLFSCLAQPCHIPRWRANPLLRSLPLSPRQIFKIAFSHLPMCAYMSALLVLLFGNNCSFYSSMETVRVCFALVISTFVSSDVYIRLVAWCELLTRCSSEHDRGQCCSVCEREIFVGVEERIYSLSTMFIFVFQITYRTFNLSVRRAVCVREKSELILIQY